MCYDTGYDGGKIHKEFDCVCIISGFKGGVRLRIGSDMNEKLNKASVA